MPGRQTINGNGKRKLKLALGGRYRPYDRSALHAEQLTTYTAPSFLCEPFCLRLTDGKAASHLRDGAGDAVRRAVQLLWRRGDEQTQHARSGETREPVSDPVSWDMYLGTSSTVSGVVGHVPGYIFHGFRCRGNMGMKDVKMATEGVRRNT